MAVPAGESLLFQLLDENGMAVMGMRSFTYVHAGETVSCVGCHAPRSAPVARDRSLGNVTVHELQPPAGPQYDGGLSFTRTVQPVLDRQCINCHGLEQTAGGVNLLGTIKDRPADVQHVLAGTVDPFGEREELSCFERGDRIFERTKHLLVAEFDDVPLRRQERIIARVVAERDLRAQ